MNITLLFIVKSLVRDMRINTSQCVQMARVDFIATLFMQDDSCDNENACSIDDKLIEDVSKYAEIPQNDEPEDMTSQVYYYQTQCGQCCEQIYIVYVKFVCFLCHK